MATKRTKLKRQRPRQRVHFNYTEYGLLNAMATMTKLPPGQLCKQLIIRGLYSLQAAVEQQEEGTTDAQPQDDTSTTGSSSAVGAVAGDTDGAPLGGEAQPGPDSPAGGSGGSEGVE